MRLARALELASAGVSQPSPDRLRGLDVDDEKVLLEPRRPRDDLSCVVEHGLRTNTIPLGPQ